MNYIIENLAIVSIQATVLILAVMLFRIVLKKTNKIFTYLMWLVVLLRLCIPVSVESPYGMFNGRDKEQIVNSTIDNTLIPSFSHQDNTDKDEYHVEATPVIKPAEPEEMVNGTHAQETKIEKGFPYTTEQVIVVVCVTGMVAVTTLAIIQVIMLKKKTRFAINSLDNIWETDGINTAFVMGVFRPRIYIPANVEQSQREHIVCHEKMHIKHGDHIVRIVMLLVNIVYWWNPMVWVATYFMKKDMEMLCDESVIKDMKMDKRGEYLTTLLNFSAKNSGIIPVMSFGETNTEMRIRHIMNLRKPKFYIFIVLTAYVVVCLVGCGKITKANTAKNNLTVNDNNNVSDERDNSNEVVDTDVINKTGYALYDELIEEMVRIQNSESENLMEAYEAQNMCYIWGYTSTFERGGFYLVDLDGDGTEELLLGENGEGAWAGTIYEIYTIKNDHLVKVCTGGERDRYYLCEGNIIGNEGSSGASYSSYNFYTYKDSGLYAITGILYDSDYNMENPWFMLEQEINVEPGAPISEKEADEIKNKYKKLSIEFNHLVEQN